ncbi:MAG: DNA mismatch repair endonuclease MutH [Gammaproteobacteria bacterium]
MQTPKTIDELEQRVKAIAGMSLGQLALEHQVVLPKDLKKEKGLVGQLLEQALGASAGCKSMPDFEQLSVELKTIPINTQGKPAESTYVCTVPMRDHANLSWHESAVYRKLAHVLWLPIEADKSISLSNRRIGMGILWQMPEAVEQLLKRDWEELMELVALGQIDSISAKQGVYLQIRPKALNNKARCVGIGPDGGSIQTLPRGFYLRASFTEMILAKGYLNQDDKRRTTAI